MTGTETALDKAHRQMEAATDDAQARLNFLAHVADSEVFLLLERDMSDDTAIPASFELDEGTVVLIFDLEDRLATFTEGAAPYAALSGRAVVSMAAAQGVGLGINLGVAPSSALLAPSDVAWLADILAQGPEETQARPVALRKPTELPNGLLAALDRKLASAAGLADHACLATVDYEDGRQALMLAFAGAQEGAERALATAVSEALIFSGQDEGALDVVFLRTGDPFLAAIQRHGMRFDLPDMVKPPERSPSAPGMDPDAPPKLR